MLASSFDGDLDDSNSRHFKKVKMFECLMDESQCNFGSVCWHYKVSIVVKGFPDLENATEPLAYNSKHFFCKISDIKNVSLSFPFETHLVFLSGTLRRIYSAFSVLEVPVVRQLSREKESRANFAQSAGRMIWNLLSGDHCYDHFEFLT